MSNDIIALTDPGSLAAEAYRTLRTNIEFSGVDEHLQTLLVTSPVSVDDKSATVSQPGRGDVGR